MADTVDTPADAQSTHPLTAEELEPGLLYAVLTYRGELASWNWAFFVPNPAVSPIGAAGTLFHVVDNDSVGLWKFEVEPSNILASPMVVAILRLADVGFLGGYEDVVGKDSLLPMFKTVAIPEHASTEFEFSSRTWFLEAICVLHDCGVVQCDDAWLLEREIRRCAFTAMDKYLDNKGANSSSSREWPRLLIIHQVGQHIDQSTAPDRAIVALAWGRLVPTRAPSVQVRLLIIAPLPHDEAPSCSDRLPGHMWHLRLTSSDYLKTRSYAHRH